MPKPRKVWLYSPPRPPKPIVPEALKAEVQTRATVLVETVLKPQHIQPPPQEARFNYLVDISTKWYRSSFYFCGRYCSPGPSALSPFFETKVARLEYVGGRCFTLSSMRHTGQWWELYADLSVEECMTAIEEEPHFFP